MILVHTNNSVKHANTAIMDFLCMIYATEYCDGLERE